MATDHARLLALAGVETRVNTAHITSGENGGQFAPKGYSGGGSGAFSGQYQSGPKTNPAKKPKTTTPAASVLNAPQGKRTLKQGQSGDDVRYLQYAMNLLGFKVAQDGVFGPDTATYVKQMQERLGLPADGHVNASMLRRMQDAVRLSPCVQQQRDLELEAGWESRDEDDFADLDDVPDDETEALIAALGGADQSEGVRSAEFNPALHPRGPGGKFRTVLDRIVGALEGWKKGTGSEHPLLDAGFKREQLRNAAKELHVPLKRGASPEEIEKALLDHARENALLKRASAPSKADVTFSLTGPGRKNVTAVVYQNSKGELFLRRETVPGHPDQQPITHQPDLASLEKWANANGEPGLAKWARGEIDKKAPTSAPAKAAKKAAPSKASPAKVAPDLLKPGQMVPPGRPIPESVADLPIVPHTRVQAGDFAVWQAPGETPLYGRVVDEGPRRKFVDWAGGRREPLTSAKSPNVTFHREAAPDLTGKGGLSTDPAVREVQVENRIRAAYKAVQARNPDTPWVGLADLRKELGDGASREEVDAALKRLAVSRGPGDANVVPESNQKTLTPADREAAVHFGDQAKHAISFDDASPKPLPAAKADHLAGLEGLTTVQKRAALRKQGFSKEQIDTLAPLKAPKAPRGPRPSGLPHDRRPASGDFEDLAGRLMGKSEVQKLEILQDLNATELAALARKFPGEAMLVPGMLKTSDRRQGLKIPDGLTLDEKRRWLAHELSQRRFHWRSQTPDDDEEVIFRFEDDAEDPNLDEIEAWAEEDPADFDDEPEAERALGHDVTPGHDELHHYWTVGEGRAKWVESPKPWTTLVAHLTKYVGPLKAKIYASRWFHEVFGFYSGSDLNRVTHGKPPRGHRVGPG